MTHGSLFSGIGGFDLGFERAGIKTLWQVEIDEYCRRVLAKHFPDAERFGDIRECGAHNLKPVDIISGGFPCQDISAAGKRIGITGSRSGLWKEMLRIVRELRPTWVLVENVDNLRRNGADTVLGDLEENDYSSWPIVVGAWAVGCKHNRNRTWILCHSNGGDALGSELGQLSVLPIKEWAMAQKEQGWHKRLNELVPRDKCEGVAAYARIVRGANGIPNRLDRFRALGNSVNPEIATMLGLFVNKVDALG